MVQGWRSVIMLLVSNRLLVSDSKLEHNTMSCDFYVDVVNSIAGKWDFLLTFYNQYPQMVIQTRMKLHSFVSGVPVYA